MIHVINSKETPLMKCHCGSLLNHWKKFTGQQVRMCLEKDCTNIDIDGCYVQKTDGLDLQSVGLDLQSRPKDSSIYLIPLCQKHRESTTELEILDTCKFVSTDLKTTCGRTTAIEVKEGEL